MTTKILCLGLTVGLMLGCGGNSKSSDGGRTHSGGAAGSSAGTSGGRGGAGAEAGSNASLGGHEAGGSGGRAALGGSSSGARGGGAGVATGGTSGAAETSGSAGVGRGGRNQPDGGAGGVGAAGQMSGSSGAAGEDTAGAAGSSGAAGSDGATCGGIAAKMCAPGQWCHWSNGSCGVGDQPGECFSSGGIACAPDPACGCDGHAYTMACRAHANGIDTTSDKACVPGDGAPGDACFVDTDCESTLKCCTSPIGLMTCMTTASGTCPLTP